MSTITTINASDVVADSRAVINTNFSNLNTDKAETASPTFTGTVVLPSTTSIGSVSGTEISYLDGVTSALQTQIDAKGVGTVTAVSVASANGVSGSSSGGATPALTITLGAITPTTVNGLTITTSTGTVTITNAKTLSVLKTMSFTSADDTGVYTLPTGTKTLLATDGSAASLTNFPTLNQNTTGSAATLTTARTIGGVSFNGSANITVASATGGFTVSGGDLALGANNITMTGSIAATGSRVTKGWFTDLEVTNAPTLNGVAIPSISSTSTLTNKRITQRISTTTTSATPTPNADTDDMYTVTALAEAATFGAPSGTPTNGQKLIIRIKDNGTARALGFNAIYRAGTDIALPTTTVLSKTLYLGFIYNSADTKWDLVAKVDNI